jgi:Raf kinase inhibitor-like YbhB/YbcL family protein
MKITSPSFTHKEMIPKKFTCQGEDVNPALIIEDIPKMTKSLVLIVDDPDAPAGVWIHWVVYNIPITGRIEENSIPGKQGINSFQKTGYGGPCPPSGTHRYYFRIYALDTDLDLEEGISLDVLKEEMKDHILTEAQIVGLYKKE